MKNFYTVLAAAGIATAAAIPAHAASHMADPETMTCADFMAMESDGQMGTVAMMHSFVMQSELPGNGENTSEGELAEENAIANADAGATNSEGAMATDESALPGNEENASEGKMAAENVAEMDDAMAEEMVTKMSDACEGNPDMMAMDAMKSDM